MENFDVLLRAKDYIWNPFFKHYVTHINHSWCIQNKYKINFLFKHKKTEKRKVYFFLHKTRKSSKLLITLLPHSRNSKLQNYWLRTISHAECHKKRVKYTQIYFSKRKIWNWGWQELQYDYDFSLFQCNENYHKNRMQFVKSIPKKSKFISKHLKRLLCTYFILLFTSFSSFFLCS